MKLITEWNKGATSFGLAVELGTQLSHYDDSKKRHLDLSEVTSRTGIGQLYNLHLLIIAQNKLHRIA
jgi:hypothetical protein